MSGYQGLLQPIVVRRTGTHEDMVVAAARASVAAWLADPENPAWTPWLAGSFGKSVRRARPVEVEKVREFMLASVKVGDAEAFAGLPVSRAEMATAIAKLQVSGTDAERSGWPELLPIEGPHLLVNVDAGMTTGKTCAQVAHGLFGWALLQDQSALAAWAEAGLPFAVSELSQRAFNAARPDAVVVIEDAGHTEVDPGTATVLAISGMTDE